MVGDSPEQVNVGPEEIPGKVGVIGAKQACCGMNSRYRERHYAASAGFAQTRWSESGSIRAVPFGNSFWNE